VTRPRVNWQLTTGFGPLIYIRTRLEPDLIFRTRARIYIFWRIYVWNWKRDHSNLFLRKNQNWEVLHKSKKSPHTALVILATYFLLVPPLRNITQVSHWRLGTRFSVLDSPHEDFFFPKLLWNHQWQPIAPHVPSLSHTFESCMTFRSYFVVFSPCQTAISNCFQCPTQAFELHEISITL
jgi:hypothetical protein